MWRYVEGAGTNNIEKVKQAVEFKSYLPLL
jgi:hypothetical protein